ncbi:hypothetical protein [Chryseobacterium sp. C3]|uniref:hypothetical protein n=1 Tax=Chryseobacterium sp. C3 TaxID=2761532 RepID=UPI00162AF1C8|nr:hypothetical protein [Chryseobacterium sp. C3]
MKTSVYIFLLALLPFNLIKSQNTVDNPYLFQTWKFKNTEHLNAVYEKSKYSDKNTLNFRLSKDGKVIANWVENICYSGDKKPKFKFKKIKGSWEKISDSVIHINFTTNVSLKGNYIISNLTEEQLTLKMFVNLKKK